jgi:hypothetical protein
LKWVLLDSCLMKKFDSFLEVQLKHWVSALEFLKWILFIYYTKLLCVSCLDSFKHKDHKFANQIKCFKVMVLNFHFQIETSELAKMSVCERLFSSENWTNLKNSLQISAKSHLFVELRTLSKTSRLTKVLKFKNIGTTFWRSSNQLRWVNLNKVFW